MKELSQNETIGKYIHDLRIKNKMALKQLSEKVNLSPGFYLNWKEATQHSA